MKKSHNKIIFGFILLIIIIFVSVKFANNTNATYRTFELLVDGGGGGPTAPTDSTDPTTTTTSRVNVSYQLKDNKYSYYPGDPILVTVGTAYNTCNNLISNTKVSGYIDDEGPSSSKTIIDNIVPGGYSLEGTGSYTAPSRVGLHNFYGRLNIYATNDPKIVISATSTSTELASYYWGRKITIEGKEYLISKAGDNDLEFVNEAGVHLPVWYVFNHTGSGRPSLNYNQAGQNLTATYFRREVTDILQKTQDFTIPFEVVANPTPKTVSVKVYDAGENLIGPNADRKTSPISADTPFSVEWRAEGFNNNNIVCNLSYKDNKGINQTIPYPKTTFTDRKFFAPPNSVNIDTLFTVNCVD